METQETAAPLVIVEISPDWTTEIATLDSESLTQSEAIRAIRAVDQETYNEAVEMGRTIATFIERVENLFERYIAPLREPLAVFYEARKSVLDLAKADKKHLALEVGRYQDDQERMRLETQRLLAAEQKRLEEEAQLNAAIEAESSGLSETSLEQILATASSAAAPMAATNLHEGPGRLWTQNVDCSPEERRPSGREARSLRGHRGRASRSAALPRRKSVRTQQARLCGNDHVQRAGMGSQIQVGGFVPEGRVRWRPT